VFQWARLDVDRAPVVETGAVGFRKGVGCRKGAGGVSKGRGWVFWAGIGGDWWCRRGSRAGRGGGDADVATDVVEAKDDGGRGADVATGVVDVDDDGGDGADVAAETGGERTTTGASVTWHVLGLRIDG
jgi:hypothetical protein